MSDLGLRGVGVDRRLNRDTDTACGQRPCGARLSARGGIENRAVKNDAALIGRRDNPGLAILEVGIVAENALGRHWRSRFLERRLDVRFALEPVGYR